MPALHHPTCKHTHTHTSSNLTPLVVFSPKGRRTWTRRTRSVLAPLQLLGPPPAGETLLGASPPSSWAEEIPPRLSFCFSFSFVCFDFFYYYLILFLMFVFFLVNKIAILFFFFSFPKLGPWAEGMWLSCTLFSHFFLSKQKEKKKKKERKSRTEQNRPLTCTLCLSLSPHVSSSCAAQRTHTQQPELPSLNLPPVWTCSRKTKFFVAQKKFLNTIKIDYKIALVCTVVSVWVASRDWKRFIALESSPKTVGLAAVPRPVNFLASCLRDLDGDVGVEAVILEPELQCVTDTGVTSL